MKSIYFMSQTDEGADSPQPVEAAVTFYFIYFFYIFLTLQNTERGRRRRRRKENIIIQDLTSPQGLISFSSLSSLTHSRQLIISLFPQIPQCTCNYHAHACLPPASCLEGGVSLSLSLSVYLSLSSPSSSLLSFLVFFFVSLFFFLLSVTCHFFSSPPLSCNTVFSSLSRRVLSVL